MALFPALLLLVALTPPAASSPGLAIQHAELRAPYFDGWQTVYETCCGGSSADPATGSYVLRTESHPGTGPWGYAEPGYGGASHTGILPIATHAQSITVKATLRVDDAHGLIEDAQGTPGFYSLDAITFAQMASCDCWGSTYVDLIDSCSGPGCGDFCASLCVDFCDGCAVPGARSDEVLVMTARIQAKPGQTIQPGDLYVTSAVAAYLQGSVEGTMQTGFASIHVDATLERIRVKIDPAPAPTPPTLVTYDSAAPYGYRELWEGCCGGSTLDASTGAYSIRTQSLPDPDWYPQPTGVNAVLAAIVPVAEHAQSIRMTATLRVDDARAVLEEGSEHPGFYSMDAGTIAMSTGCDCWAPAMVVDLIDSCAFCGHGPASRTGETLVMTVTLTAPAGTTIPPGDLWVYTYLNGQVMGGTNAMDERQTHAGAFQVDAVLESVHVEVQAVEA